MPKTTPGPWTVNGAHKVESEKEHGWANDGWIICEALGPDAAANARLIAAAPELLDVLCDLLKPEMCTGDEDGDHCNHCRAERIIDRVDGE